MSRLLSSPKAIAGVIGVLSFAIRVPFLFRYDLHFGADAAVCYLMALRITQGDRPFYFYGQDYQGAPEAYAAAFLLNIIGPSIGLGLYVGKQCLPAVAAAVGVMAVSSWPNAKWPIRRWPILAAAAVAGFFLGYSPEIWYRLNSTETRSFVGTVNPLVLWQNAKFTLASILALPLSIRNRLFDLGRDVRGLSRATQTTMDSSGRSAVWVEFRGQGRV